MARARRRSLTGIALAAVSVTAALEFARVYDGNLLVPVLGAAVLPHALGRLVRRLHWPTAVEALLPAGALLLYLVWVTAADTTILGIPTLESFEKLGTLLGEGGRVLREESAPVAAGGGPLLLGVAAVWLGAQISDALAFRARAALGAVVPQLVLVVVIAVIGTEERRTALTVAFALAVLAFLLGAQLDRLELRRSWSTGSRALALRRLVGIGALAGALAVALGTIVGPALPGADAEPLLDTKGGDGDQGNITAELLPIAENLRIQPPQPLFTVDTGGAEPRNWRLVSYDRFGRGGWGLSEAFTERLDGPFTERRAGTVELAQRFTIDRMPSSFLPAAYEPAGFLPITDGFDDVRYVRETAGLLDESGDVRGSYEVLSYAPNVPFSAEQQAELARRPPQRRLPEGFEQYTDLPDDLPQEITDAASAAVADADTPYEQAQALEKYFDPANGFVYDLEPDLPGQSSAAALAAFLEPGNRRGFCVQYASVLALMARSVGLPARVAVGFTRGEQLAPGRYRVTTDQAHMWPEVWLPGTGWTPLEPTPPRPDTGAFFNPDDPTNPPGAVPPPAVTSTTRAVPVPPDFVLPTSLPFDRTTPTTTPAAASGGVPRWLVVTGLAVAAILLGVVTWCSTIIGLKARRRRHRKRASDPRFAVTGAWDEALDRLREVGIRPPPPLTPVEFAHELPRRGYAKAGRTTSELAHLTTTARWSPAPVPAEDARRAWEEVVRLGVVLSEGVARTTRLRRRLDVRTLRR